MKRLYSIFLIVFTFFCVPFSQAQKNNRFEKFKEMKLNFILENTDLNSSEREFFKQLFEESENKYHNEVWLLQRKVRNNLRNVFDTISAESASKFINDYYKFEQLGMTIKHERNQKLLESIRPKFVLLILQQEKEFDQVMFKRIRDNPKTKKEREKE